MPRGYLALVVELHHRLPGPGEGPGPDWAVAAVETYWPLLRAISAAADAGLAEVLTLAVSPSWVALAADPEAQDRTRAELDRRVAGNGGGPDDRDSLWPALRQFVLDQWAADPLAPIRRACESGTVEVIPTTASQAWMPGVVRPEILARIQVGPAAAEHARRFGTPAQGMWLPFRSFAPGLEPTLARFELRYFAVDAEAFRRGTVRPPRDLFGPLITPPGAAAFGIDPEASARIVEAGRRSALHPVPAASHPEPIAERAGHLLAAWRANAEERAPRDAERPPLSLAAVSAHDLGGLGPEGSAWLERFLGLLGEPDGWRGTTLGRYLDRHPEGPVGRPGPTAGGWAMVCPGGSDLHDRVRLAADVLADAVARRARLRPLGRRAVAQMTRELLRAQSLDAAIPPRPALDTGAWLARSDRHLARFAELAGRLAAGCLDPVRLADLEAGLDYLPEIDLESLAAG